MDGCISSVLRLRRATRIAQLLTPHVGATAANFHAERITEALLDGGDVVAVTANLLPLPPEVRRTAAVQVANAWVELSAGH